MSLQKGTGRGLQNSNPRGSGPRFTGKAVTVSVVSLAIAGVFAARAWKSYHYSHVPEVPREIFPPDPPQPPFPPDPPAPPVPPDPSLPPSSPVSYNDALTMIEKGLLVRDGEAEIENAGDFIELYKAAQKNKDCSVDFNFCANEPKASFTYSCDGVSVTFSTSDVVSFSLKSGNRSKSVSLNDLLDANKKRESDFTFQDAMAFNNDTSLAPARFIAAADYFASAPKLPGKLCDAPKLCFQPAQNKATLKLSCQNITISTSSGGSLKLTANRENGEPAELVIVK